MRLLYPAFVTFLDIMAILIAPFIGSFLGLVIDRLPEGRPILMGRSQCDHCSQTLGPPDLIPLLNYLWLSGRCRHCGVALRRFYPLIELAALSVAASAALVLSGWILWVSLYLGFSLLALAAIDARHTILPDVILLPLIPIGLMIIVLLSPDRLPAHLVGAVSGFLVFAGIAWVYRKLRARDGLGLGDAKLLAAAGAWLGWEALPGVVFAAALSALTVALARSAMGDKMTGTDEMAFGPYLVLALWASWLLGPLKIG